MFCTLQLVWQARPPPESATGMGNTPQSGRQATLPRYRKGGGCTLSCNGWRSAEEEGRLRPSPSVGFRSKSVLGEEGGRAQEGRGKLAGVAGGLAVVRHSEAVIHPYYAPVTLDAALSTAPLSPSLWT